MPILPQSQQAAGTLGVAVNKLTTTAEGAILLKFLSEESAEYVVQLARTRRWHQQANPVARSGPYTNAMSSARLPGPLLSSLAGACFRIILSL